MPSVPIYIRKEDWVKWDSIKDKPEFIHNALNVRGAYNRLEHEQKKTVKKVIKTTADAAEAVKEVFPDAEPIYKKTDWGA